MATPLHSPPTFYPRRVNQYVPKMRYSADIGSNGLYRVSFGSPVVADADGLLNGVNASDGEMMDLTGLAIGAAIQSGVIGAIGRIADATYGRNVTVAGVTSPHDIDIEGFDYLGQPMQETIAAAATSGAGAKAFKEVTKVLFTDGGDADCDVGWGDVLGLPYGSIKVLAAELAGVTETTLPTLVSSIRTDPHTIVTADPRGTIDLNSALAGTEVTALLVAESFINAIGNGGLHGIAHFMGTTLA